MKKPKKTGVWQIGLLAGTSCYTDQDAIDNLAGQASRPLQVFQDIKVRTKRNFPDVKSGTEVILTPMPQGKLYLSFEGCFCTDAREGKDFEFI